MAPCLLGLLSVISLAFADYARCHRVHPATAAGHEKTDVTYSDPLACLRRLLWDKTVLGTSRYGAQYAKLTPGLQTLSPAA